MKEQSRQQAKTSIFFQPLQALNSDGSLESLMWTKAAGPDRAQQL